MARGSDGGRVGKAFTDFLACWSRERGLQVLSTDCAKDESVNGLLRESGFSVFKRKIFVTRELEGYRSPYQAPFSYHSLADAGEDRFVEALAGASEGDPFEEPGQDPHSFFRDFVDYAGEVFDPTWWKIAFLNGDSVGVVLPQRYAGGCDEGSIFYVGVIPAFRGRGFGREIHAAGLEFLAQRGVTTYFGSTDSRNRAMERVLLANGCRRTMVQLLFRAGKEGKKEESDRVLIG